MPIQFLVITAILFMFCGCSPATGVYHSVEKGQTLYRISRTYHVNEQYIARLNGIDDPGKLEIGQKIFIPGAGRVLKVTPLAPRRNIATKSAPSVKHQEKSAKHERRGTHQADAPPAVKGKFLWPVKGKIVKNFGSHRGETCKGVEISASEGTPVCSAAAGKVTYSGNGIRGYGNLIIIQHDDGYYTIYGFNKKNYVHAGTYVGKGEKIAMSGTPPGGGKGKIHFEIRFGKTAVNPIFYLP